MLKNEGMPEGLPSFFERTAHLPIRFLLIVAGGQSDVDKASAVSREGGSAKLSDLPPCAGHHPDPWELDVFVHVAGQLSQTAGAVSYPKRRRSYRHLSN
jgi:hypothetical protein